VPLRTTSDTLDDFQNAGIPWETVPKTFQDAIDMTQLLGIKYIWIDSLCIVQDDVDDWRHEGSKMADIYAGAYTTLAATSASNSGEGLYQHRSIDRLHSNYRTNYHTYTLENHVARGSTYEISVRHWRDCIDSTRLERLPLSTRAWALQEKLLSPRVVHFANDMLYWECLETSLSESGEPVFHYESTLTNSMLVDVSRAFWNGQDWRSIVEAHTSRRLTFSEDRLPALQGIAKHVKRKRACAYYAGLWEDTLCYDLLWTCLDRAEERSSKYLAPSWSWASVQQPIEWQFTGNLHVEALIVQVETIPLGDDPLGGIAFGKLVLRGLCPKRVLYPAQEEIHAQISYYMDEVISEAQENEFVTILIANYFMSQFFLILRLVDAKSRIFRRIGLLRYRRNEDPRAHQYYLFDKTVQRRYDKGESWEGCPEYQEVTII
jgi:hypothetical protein